MANRSASAAMQAEWAKAANEPAHLYEFYFDAGDGGTQYLTDSYRAISWGGNTYVAGGHMLGWSGLVESAELKIADISVQVSGVDQTWIANLLLKQYMDRRLAIRKLFFNQLTEQLIVDPIPIHDGRMDEPRVSDDPSAGVGKSIITIKSNDQFKDFERLAGRHTNPTDQNLWFPNDRSFDMVAQLAGSQVQLIWGAPSLSSAAQTTASLQTVANALPGNIF